MYTPTPTEDDYNEMIVSEKILERMAQLVEHRKSRKLPISGFHNPVVIKPKAKYLQQRK